PLVQQFNLMQQQMFDQFQQTVAMMFNLFGALHQEQVALIREELRHIQKLTAELTGLRGQLGNLDPTRREGEPQREDRPAEGCFPPWAPSPSATPPPESTAPGGARRPARGVPPASAVPRGETSGPQPAPADVHSWLTNRIEELEAERQTRWQRIL